jgi:hypothetical protein
MTIPYIELAGGREYSWLKSAARIASPGDVDIRPPYDAAGVAITVDLTALTTAASLTLTVEGYDPTSGKTWVIATTAAISTVSTVTLRIHPNDATAALANGVQTQQGQLAPHLRLHMVQGNANSTTYSVGVAFTD